MSGIRFASLPPVMRRYEACEVGRALYVVFESTSPSSCCILLEVLFCSFDSFILTYLMVAHLRLAKRISRQM